MKYTITFLLWLALGHHSTADSKLIAQLALDEAVPLEIGISAKRTTTLRFPRPLSGLVAFGLTDGQGPGTYQYQHPPGSRFLTLRNVIPDQDAYLTVILGEHMYVLHLTPAPNAAVALHLVENASEPMKRVAKPVAEGDLAERRLEYSEEKLLNLLQLGRGEAALRRVLPQVFQGVESRRHLALRYDDGQTATEITEAHRFGDEDAIMLRATIENLTEQALRYDPASLQVKVSQRVYPVTVVDGPEQLPARGKLAVHLIVKGDGSGERAHLSIKNDFRLMISAVEPWRETEESLSQYPFPPSPRPGLPEHAHRVDAALFGRTRSQLEAKGGK